MPRDIKEDYGQLESFLESYTISNNLSNKDYKTNLTKQHKRYFALLIFTSELKYQKFDPVDVANPNHDRLMEKFYNHIAECASEMGSAYFVWIHGCYKVSKQALRSVIENFFKGIGSVYYDDITEKKNTYEVIEYSREIFFFKDPSNKVLLEYLINHYVELCASVHTATFQDMQNINSLGYFPHFSKSLADEVASKYISICENILTILCLMYPNVYKSMHYRNRDILNSVLNKETKKRLLEL